MTDHPWPDEWHTFRPATPEQIRTDMQREYANAMRAGVDPMGLYRGYLARARTMKDIIDQEPR